MVMVMMMVLVVVVAPTCGCDREGELIALKVVGADLLEMVLVRVSML